MQLWLLFLCIFLASFLGNEGLELKVSNEVPYRPLGSNVTIYCTDEASDDLDWLKGPKGQSHLSACSLTRSCLPSGNKYTVDLKNRRFNLNLYNLKHSDCGTYWCKHHDDRLSYKVELLERVNNIDKRESDGSLSITTNCVLPTFTVDVQWYYIYKDGPPRIYEQPANRVDERGRCQGSCEGNHAMKISSTLTPPIGGNNLVPVKFMAYVRQGDTVQQVTFSREYMIGGCAGSPIWHIVVFILIPATICIVCNVLLIVTHVRGNKPGKDIVSNSIAIWICLVMLICFGIHLGTEKEPIIPDVFGTCHDNSSSRVVVLEVCCILIVVGLIAETIYHFFMRWRQPHTKEDDIDIQEGMPMLHGHSTDVDSGAKIVHSQSPLEKAEEHGKQVDDPIEREKKSECNVSLPCTPGVRNMSVYDVEGRAKLECSLNTEKYPSWQGPDGSVINYGGEKEFIHKNVFIWHEDKRSLIIEKVQISYAGKYVCFSSEGAVLTVDLVVRLPPETVDASPSETTILKISEKMPRHFPLWRRWNNLNAELHKELFVENMTWDADNKGLIIKNIQKKDEGDYEVCCNNLVQRFTVSVKASSNAEKERIVEHGTPVRLDCSSIKDFYPSWECLESGIYNIAGEAQFRRRKYPQKVDARFGWSADKRSLLIRGIHLDDSGTYVCRHSDGTIESVIVVVKGKPYILTREKGSKEKLKIQHNTGYKYPALTKIGLDEDGLTISHQNYKNKKIFEPKNENEGVLTHASQETTIECSTFRGCIQVYQIQD